MTFWADLKKPIIGLAPMDGVTDQAMRFITAKYGQPSIVFTEFINVEYAIARPDKLLARFWYSPNQHPIVAQLSGVSPKLFYQFAFIAADLGFDGVDINMGCPARSVTRRGAGAGLINNKPLAEKLILSTRKGLDDWEKNKKPEIAIEEKLLVALKKTKKEIRKLGVKRNGKRKMVGLSVKTRLGTNKPVVKDWLGFLSRLPINALTVHGRLLVAGHSGPVDYQALGQGAEIARRNGKIFLGNGGVKTLVEAKKITDQYRLDGFLLGRGVMGNPWLFVDRIPENKERFSVMREHCRYYLGLFGEDGFVTLRKHLVWYINNFSGAKKLRKRLVEAKNLVEIEKILENEEKSKDL